MCSPATCAQCGKATYRGCGQHVDQVLAGVPQEQRCECTTSNSTAGTAAGAGAGFFSWRRN